MAAFDRPRTSVRQELKNPRLPGARTPIAAASAISRTRLVDQAAGRHHAIRDPDDRGLPDVHHDPDERERHLPSWVSPVRTAHTTLGAVGYRVLGSAPPLVLINGFGASMEPWEPMFVDALARHHPW